MKTQDSMPGSETVVGLMDRRSSEVEDMTIRVHGLD